MSRARSILAVAVCALLLGGCKSETESTYAKVADAHGDAAKVLKGVTDRESAEAAKIKLLALAKDVREQFQKARSSKGVPEAETRRLVEKYKPQIDQARQDVASEMARIGKIDRAMFPVAEGMMAFDRATAGF